MVRDDDADVLVAQYLGNRVEQPVPSVVGHESPRCRAARRRSTGESASSCPIRSTDAGIPILVPPLDGPVVDDVDGFALALPKRRFAEVLDGPIDGRPLVRVRSRRRTSEPEGRL